MDERTREYLRGRFGDYYRQSSVELPPAANEREWGHIPWTPGTGTTMVRHQSQLDLGDVDDFLARESPRHAYFSAARYTDPSAGTMSKKGWQGADLVFDLDADHLPSIDPDESTYAEMLSACKDALYRLLTFVEDDFGFDDVSVVFSGGRGYHVHVRDPEIQDLDSDARREIVDYIRANELDTDGLIRIVSPGATNQRMLQTEGGWGRRVHREMVDIAEELREMDDDDAVDRLTEIDGIGDGRAETILGALKANPDAIAEGNMEAGGPGIRLLKDTLVERVVENQTAPIDEPVTTDTHRLIRLPKTLHGGSGLVVQPIDREDLDEFDPLVDAVPEAFGGQEITIETDEPRRVDLAGDITKLEPGTHTVTEYVGVFLMARGEAEKVST
ncbi:DNA primase small subunit [Halohasta litchfieldiae]|jgi:DNA primase small subunit|uniref:DNA primase small subunit PriS n=1 Tax=Halohasta litchfieldiae TaxID=1073996 RepID=A0A1H6T2S5_9EURY|nr:DNA primase small subunit PriS [Halohasta litchfieldiae]ATW86906.1 DNA primase small subunit [Halohasta litchfieldiae]SEI70082.1 DNA primase small subunit [Halohasta litchfieldiae]